MEKGRKIISASFVIPYPPGFPVLVPGQVMTKEILNFLLALDVKEIHGFRPELGLRVFTEKALNPFLPDQTKESKKEEPVNGNQNGSSKRIKKEKKLVH